MADITMCSGEGCNKSLSCYRHTAPMSDYWQSMFIEPPLENGECKYFWDNKERQDGSKK